MNYPPPPPRSGNGSCWKWGGIACVGCGCVGVLAIAALLAFTFSRPEVREQFSRVMSTAQEASVTVQRMQAVGEAIGKFVEDNGRYPERLVDITPRYIEAGMLKATDRPDAKPIVYHKPPDNAPPTF
ncbi:MAG: hypothetical protein GX446_12205, partial [Chthonomonadales bacterium]|nr:hypothetical protein [Chthonomonadales bacterium]